MSREYYRIVTFPTQSQFSMMGENDLWYRGLGAHYVLTLLGPGLNYKGLVAFRKVVFQFILTSDMTLVWTFLDDIPGDVM